MAMSKDAESLTERIEDGIDFTNQMKTDLEERFGLLYSKGKPKELSVLEKQKLKLLYKALDALKVSIETFQTDSSEVCGIYEDRLKPFDMRPEKGRAARDSKIDSGYAPSPQSSYSRLSRSSTGNVDSIAEHMLNANIEDPEEPEKAELYNPSSNESSGNSIPDRNSNAVNDINSDADSDINSKAPDENTDRKPVPSFYLNSPSPSTTSLTNQDVVVYPPAFGSASNTATAACSVASTAEQNKTKELNNLNKTSSNEENAEQAEELITSAE